MAWLWLLWSALAGFAASYCMRWCKGSFDLRIRAVLFFGAIGIGIPISFLRTQAGPDQHFQDAMMAIYVWSSIGAYLLSFCIALLGRWYDRRNPQDA